MPDLGSVRRAYHLRNPGGGRSTHPKTLIARRSSFLGIPFGQGYVGAASCFPEIMTSSSNSRAERISLNPD